MGWRIVWGWVFALAASAILPAWGVAERISANHLGRYVDPATGAWTAEVYWQFLDWWLPIAAPVSVLALACMYLDRAER